MSEIGEVKEEFWMILIESIYQLATGIGLGIILGFLFVFFRLFKRRLTYLTFVLMFIILFCASIGAHFSGFNQS